MKYWRERCLESEHGQGSGLTAIREDQVDGFHPVASAKLRKLDIIASKYPATNGKRKRDTINEIREDMPQPCNFVRLSVEHDGDDDVSQVGLHDLR